MTESTTVNVTNGVGTPEKSLVYRQKTGELFYGGKRVATGYSGRPGEFRNNPEREGIPNKGPIPKGVWSIEKIHGPLNDTWGSSPIQLKYSGSNLPTGRNGNSFWIHEGSTNASAGCIVLQRGKGDLARVAKLIEEKKITSLQVVP